MKALRSDKGKKRVLTPAKHRSLRMTDLDWAKFIALGGSKWLRLMINNQFYR